jgi:hypothetical protein
MHLAVPTRAITGDGGVRTVAEALLVLFIVALIVSGRGRGIER